ncbi:DUF3231 family protein [Paenibacillus septentrionalis]|uniref:DUF3231 family protein n=1 Tax=Paenibacillus septentrionalis TaxID=429342 RepID=A0ABW1V277_9BACL
MGILSGNPKEQPLHYGEVYTLWMSSWGAKGSVSCYELYLNHAGDKDLKKIINDLLDQKKLEIKEIDAILLENGIAPPPVLPERPSVELDDIPVGARFTDPEIAAKLSVEASASLVGCSTAMGQSIREDIGALYGKYHLTMTALGLRILEMSKEKGWLMPPPLHVQGSEDA